LTSDGTYLYMAAGIESKIYRVKLSDSSVTTFGAGGTGNGQFISPSGIDNDGTYLYIADNGNTRIQKLTLAGAYTAKWSVAGTTAFGLAVANGGQVLVTDSTLDTVTRYSNTGTLIDAFSQDTAFGVGVAADDTVWVTELASDTLNEWAEETSAFTWDAGLLVARAIPRT
jgi:VCBS repeat-containing protein